MALNAFAGIRIMGIITILLTLLSVGNGHGIGISPPKVELNFQPNMIGEREFCVVNTDYKDFDAEIYVKGDLAEYVTLTSNRIHFDSDEYQKCSTYTYELPSSLEIGHYDTRIGAVESEGTGGSGISARAAVEMKFLVNALSADEDNTEEAAGYSIIPLVLIIVIVVIIALGALLYSKKEK